MPKLTVLIDNNASIPGLRGQHGLSVWLEAGASRILFDTGRDSIFLENAEALDIQVTAATHMVLSHGHYDHTGGVPNLLELGAQPTVVVGPEAWAQRRSSHPIGITWPQELLGNLPVKINQKTYNIEPGIIVANVGGAPDAATRHPQLQRLVDGRWEPDTFPDEQILMLRTTKGIVVVTGCTHCGLDSLIRCVINIAGDAPIFAIIGGLHLGESTGEEIMAISSKLRGVEHIWANHCTGSTAFEMLRDALGPRVKWAGAAFHAELPPLIQ